VDNTLTVPRQVCFTSSKHNNLLTDP
jgi:hypothetical protein